MLETSVCLKEGVVETGNNDAIREVKMYDFIHHLFHGLGPPILSSATVEAREDDDSDEELYSTSHYAFTSKYTRINVIISFLETYYLVTGSIICAQNK